MRVAGVLGDGDRSAAGVGVGGSSSVSQLSWLLRLAAASEQANLTRRPPRPRRCHTEHSTTHHIEKPQKLKRISAREIHCWLWLKVSFQQNYSACDRHDLSSEMSSYHLENVKQLKTHLGWEASLRICPGGNRC